MPLDRRDFIKASAATAGALVLGFYISPRDDNSTVDDRTKNWTPNAWLRIARDGSITILVEKPELGQGSRTYTAMMVAEELEADWKTIRVEQAPTIPSVYHGLRTAGSSGVASSFTSMRRVGAQAREMLIAAAAQRWNVAPGECRAERGIVVHARGRRMSFGELVDAASRLSPPDPEQLPLKLPRDFRVIGTPARRVDVPSKVDGSARFGIDVRVPDMLFAVIARCPHFGGTLESFDAARALAVSGVRAVFVVRPLPRRFNTAGGVAVVADSTWAAMTGRKALTIRWGRGSNENTDDLRRSILERVRVPSGLAVVSRGDAPAVLAKGGRIVSGEYESPFQAHATMEPMNTTVHVRSNEIEVWSPTQFADEVQREIAELAGLPLQRVIVHMTLSGGSFGRRYQWDVPAEAWQVADKVKRPVQLLWTREDDMQHDFYRPYNYQSLTARLDEEGSIEAWSTRIVTTPIVRTNVYTGMKDGPEALTDPRTVAALEWSGADAAPYAVPNVRVEYLPVDSDVPRSWWRSVAASYTVFAKECFVDELAHVAKRDALEYRIHLARGASSDVVRLRTVLQTAAKHADWGAPLPARRGRGIACLAGDTCSAHVAEVSVDANGIVRVGRVVAAIDCGIAVNPDGVRAMTEGAIDFALTAVLMSQITTKDGAVEQSNFHDYRVLRLDQAPDVQVHIVPSDREPSGVGELGVMLIGAAVANAVFAATGVRVRRLPIDSRLLRR